MVQRVYAHLGTIRHRGEPHRQAQVRAGGHHRQQGEKARKWAPRLLLPSHSLLPSNRSEPSASDGSMQREQLPTIEDY